VRSCSCVVTLLLMNIFFKIRSVRSGSVWNYSRAITSLRSLQQPGQACLKRRRRSPVERRALLPGALVCLSLVGLFVSSWSVCLYLRPPLPFPRTHKIPCPCLVWRSHRLSLSRPPQLLSGRLPPSLVACLPLSGCVRRCGGTRRDRHVEAQEEMDLGTRRRV
jgi:hypothetical protein